MKSEKEGMNVESIAEGSNRNGNSKDSLEKKRSWANVIEKASHSAEIYTSTDTDPNKLSQKRESKLTQLEEKSASHPEPRYPERRETVSRWITTRDSLPKVTQSHEATQNIITNARSLRDMLDNPKDSVASKLSQKALQEITFLVSLANDQYGKGYRKPNDVKDDGKHGKEPMKATDDTPGKSSKEETDGKHGKEPMKATDDTPGKSSKEETDGKTDGRLKKEIKRELTIYRAIDRNLDQWKAFLGSNREGMQPSIEKTLALWLKQAKTRVEHIDQRFQQVFQVGDYLRSIPVFDLEQSSSIDEEKDMQERLKDLRSQTFQARDANSENKDAIRRRKELTKEFISLQTKLDKKVHDRKDHAEKGGTVEKYQQELQSHVHQALSATGPEDLGSVARCRKLVKNYEKFYESYIRKIEESSQLDMTKEERSKEFSELRTREQNATERFNTPVFRQHAEKYKLADNQTIAEQRDELLPKLKAAREAAQSGKDGIAHTTYEKLVTDFEMLLHHYHDQLEKDKLTVYTPA